MSLSWGTRRTIRPEKAGGLFIPKAECLEMSPNRIRKVD